ncbi:Tctex1 domain-containing protein 1 [Bulinus truncatus]|nr:Tctex1 domain-containing protein 1 [Bulinus truncatus]
MSFEPLTQKALEQHDRVHPKIAPNKDRATTSKDEQKSVKGRNRLLSKTDSTKSILNGSFRGMIRLYSRTESNRSLPYGTSDVGISSRHSIATPRPSAGLSVFRLIAAARAWKRLSQKKLLAIPDKPKVEMENTYRLGPETGEKFLPRRVESMIDDVLTRYLRHFKYVPEASKQMCLAISSEVKSRVKSFGFPRYKYVCMVFLFQNKGQGTKIGSRCLWSPTTDSSASCTYKNNQFICVVNVHAVYFE